MFGNLRGRHVLNVRLPTHQQLNHSLADIKPDDAVPGLAKLHRKRETDVAQTNDATDGRPVGEFRE